MGWTEPQPVTVRPTQAEWEQPAGVGGPHVAGTDPTCRVCQAQRRRDTADEDDR